MSTRRVVVARRPQIDGSIPDVIVAVDAPAIDSGRETCYGKAV